ncbi:F-box/WD repeat-containing protein 7 [Xenopus laevis]|nr:F-box/WD repeat-containing protein 7 [Xenopus laevis]XP_041416992.1 F-box/WD repeat-containing protein 7 [Xenopus laevis]
MERTRRAQASVNQSRMEASDYFVSQLPDELALRILWYLDGKDILQVAQTCQRWRQLAEDEGLWQGKCKADGIDEPLCITRRKAKASRSSPWKSAYIHQLRIDSNWRQGRFKTKTLDISAWDMDFTTWTFDGKQLVCIVCEKTIKIWSAVSGKHLRTLEGHTDNIFPIQMRDHIIVSGSKDRTVKVWNAESGECIHTLCHTHAVWRINIHEKWVVTGSSDDSIRIWDIETGQCLHVLMVQLHNVRYIHYDGQRLVSVDDTLKIWDPETQSCLVTFPILNKSIRHSELKGTRLLLADEDATITVWDTDTGQCIQTITDLQRYIAAISLRANILLWGDGLPVSFDRKRFQRYVENVRLQRNFVISNTGFGPVPLWELESTTVWDRKEDIFLWRLRKKNRLVCYFMVSQTKLICVIGGREEQVKVKVLNFDYWETRGRKRL